MDDLNRARHDLALALDEAARLRKAMAAVMSITHTPVVLLCSPPPVELREILTPEGFTVFYLVAERREPSH